MLASINTRIIPNLNIRRSKGYKDRLHFKNIVSIIFTRKVSESVILTPRNIWKKEEVEDSGSDKRGVQRP